MHVKCLHPHYQTCTTVLLCTEWYVSKEAYPSQEALHVQTDFR